LTEEITVKDILDKMKLIDQIEQENKRKKEAE